MKLVPQPLRKILKPLIKQRPLRSEIESFKSNLIALLDKIALIEKQPKDESEEHLKNNVRDFLRDTYYKETNAINTKDKKDLVVHTGKSTDSEVAVIIEAKRPSNTSEMISVQDGNRKALHELVLYYLDERHKNQNVQLKHLIITNIYEWYIIDANFFDKYIYRNPQIKKLYELKLNDKKDNPFFYEELFKIFSKLDLDIPCIHFNIRSYDKQLRNNKTEDDKHLLELYKVFSPVTLLKLSPKDTNSLNAAFYKELLHIIGLSEEKDSGKIVIKRKKEPDAASLLELTIDAIVTEDVLHRVNDLPAYGNDKEDQLFNIALELCITWINRILFLKLLEAQLTSYHKGDKAFKFLNAEVIADFDELFNLFHKVLAVNTSDRSNSNKIKYSRIPYLNSSLFDFSPLEQQAIKINTLNNDTELPITKGSVLAKYGKNKIPTLEYLFRFLDAYDFASEGKEEIEEDNKPLINASVLGKVFEKINGYKDGSIFTPAFITMYMCRQSIRKAAVKSFNDALSSTGELLFESFDDVKNYHARHYKTADVIKSNNILNSIRICDPAVGSGHFLVSALNELIVVKAELGILADENGNIISNYEIDVINDELLITDHSGNPVEYLLEDGRPNAKIQHLQKTLFHQKQTIIENCLFGVDINPKSVLICRLRLWIELLKNAYYKEPDYQELETLPNIDINIKCGNSLVSRFSLDADLSTALKSIKYSIEEYRKFVADYKNEKNREVKKGLLKIIEGIKSDFQTQIFLHDSRRKKLISKTDELNNLLHQTQLFDITLKEKKQRKEKQQKLEKEIELLSSQIEEIKSNKYFKNSFEWRFEFPEVLNNNGDFEGFDVIIGNPPYIQLQKLDLISKTALEKQNYKTFAKTGDIYQLFYEKGLQLLKQKGLLAFITSNKWMRTDYGIETRRLLASNCNTTLVLDFGMELIFENATILTNILFLTKEDSKEVIRMCRVKDEYDKGVLLEDYVDFAAIEMKNPEEKSWIPYDKKEYALIQKICNQEKKLKTGMLKSIEEF